MRPGIKVSFSTLGSYMFSEKFLAIFVFAGLIELCVAIRYYPFSFTEKFSFLVHDQITGSFNLIGEHSFSDLTSSITAASTANPWQSYGVIYTPVVMLLLKIVGLGAFHGLLILFLLFITASALFPIVASIEKLKASSLFIVIGLFSPALISIFDRGNLIGFLPLLLFCFYVNLNNGKTITSSFFLSLAVSLKIYTIFFVLFLLVFKKYKVAGLTLLITASINYIAAFFFGSPISILKELYKNLLAFNGGFHGYSIAETGAGNELLGLLKCLGFGSNTTYSWVSSNLSVLGIVVLVLSIAAAKSVHENYWIFFALYCIELVPASSYIYSECWVFVAIPIMLTLGKERAAVNTDNQENLVINETKNYTIENSFKVIITLNISLFYLIFSGVNVVLVASFTFFVSCCVYLIIKKFFMLSLMEKKMVINL